jgi:regulator of sigma E protease
LSLVIAILGLALLILVHEAGHFFVARLVGMRPTRFYIGFPPALAKMKRGGIEYGIGAIPLGGYVRIPGMHRPAAGDVDVHLAPALNEAPQLYGPAERLKRPLADGRTNEALAAASELEDAVGRALLSPAAARAAERGIREIRESLSPEAYWRQRAWKRIAVIFAGPGTNLLFAVVLFAALFMVSGGKPTLQVSAVLDDHPAAAAGLLAGDRIVSIDGIPLRADEVSTVVARSDGRPLRLVVERDHTIVNLKPARPTKIEGVYRLGFILRAMGLSPPAAIWHSIRLTGLVTKQIGESLSHLVHGQGRKQISSPVGIVQGSSTALNEGIENYLWVLGLISLSLALLNLLPLLPLDGGHIAFSIVEGIRGRAVRREVYERVSAVGIFLVVLLFFVGLSNDVGRLGGG